MRSVSGAMNSGVKMGFALGGLGRNQEAAQSGQAYFEKLRAKFVENAVGIKRNKMGDLEAPSWMTPPEAEYAKAQYLKVEEAGYDKALQTSIQMSALRTNIIKQFKENIDTEGINPETQRGLTANLEKSYIELLGPETYRKLGIDLQSRLALVQNAQEATKIHDTFLLNGLSNAYLEYTANPTTDNLRKYTTLYAENPKKFKDLDFANPQKLFESLKTNENFKITMGREKQEKQQAANIQAEKEIRVAKENATPSIPEFQKKIEAMLKEIPGLTREEATKIGTGVLRVQREPVTNEISLVDLSNNTVRKLSTADVENEQVPELESGTRKTLWEIADDATGPMSTIKAGASVVSGMVGGPVAGPTLQARQYIVAAQNDLVRSLSINPRFPVSEINRIKEEIKIEPSFFDSGNLLKNRMIAIDGYLSNRMEKEVATYQNKNVPADQRKAAMQAIVDIGAFLKTLGAKDKVEGQEDTKQNYPKITGVADYKKIKSGERYIDPNGIVRVKP